MHADRGSAPATEDGIESEKEGEIVRFRVHNAGKLAHEFVLGTPEELAAHAAMMRNGAPADPMHHGDGHSHDGAAHHANALTVAPGKTASLKWQSTRPGTYPFACLIPGHYEAGMRGEIAVEPR